MGWQRPDPGAQPPRPTARGAQTPVTSPTRPCCHRAEHRPSSQPGPQRLTEDVFPVQEGHFAQDGNPRLLQPILGPALGGLHELGHLGKGRGLIREAEGGPGTPATEGHPLPPRSRPGLQTSRPRGPFPPREVAAEAKRDHGAVPPWDLLGWGKKGHHAPGNLPWGTLFMGKGEVLA